MNHEASNLAPAQSDSQGELVCDICLDTFSDDNIFIL